MHDVIIIYDVMNRISKISEFMLRTLSCSACCLKCCRRLTTDQDKVPPEDETPDFGYIAADSSLHDVLRQVLLVDDLHTTNDSTRFIQPLPFLREGVRKEESQKTIANEEWSSCAGCTKTLRISLIKMKRCPGRIQKWVHQKIARIAPQSRLLEH